MRCCRNFSCIEWDCVLRIFFERNTHIYASSWPTFHIFLLQIFEFLFLAITFVPKFHFAHPRFELSRRKLKRTYTNMKNLLLRVVHFELRFGCTMHIESNNLAIEFLGQSHWARYILKILAFIRSILLPHEFTHIHTSMNRDKYIYSQTISTNVIAMQSNLGASFQIFDWHSVYISKFHSNPIIILWTQNHSLYRSISILLLLL